jgi:hypothetical protein
MTRLLCRLSLLAGLAAGALVFTGLALANAQGGWRTVVGCPDGVCNIRLALADETRSTTSWTVPSSTFGYNWIDVQNTEATACNPSLHEYCIVQAGYAKFTSTAAPAACGAVGTGGSVKIVYYAIYSNGFSRCDFSDFTVSPGDTHNIKIARCAGTSSDWCTSVDFSLKHQYVGPTGIGSTAPESAVTGEFACDSCMDATTYIGSYWGGPPASGYPWEIGDLSSPAQYVTSQYATLKNYAPCGSGSHSSWHIETVNTSQKWLINWSNGGTAC